MIQARQEEFILRHIEKRFGRQFITYRGRSVFGSQEWVETDLRSRISGFVHEARQVWGADVDFAVKRHTLSKLAAAFLIPTSAYDALKSGRAHRTPPQLAMIGACALNRRARALVRGRPAAPPTDTPTERHTP
jgi:hypothetical protein